MEQAQEICNSLTAPKPAHRPSSYNQDIADQILDGLAEGKSLISVCKEIKVHYSTVARWLDKYADFRDRYTLARAEQADYLAEEIISLADDESITPDSRRIRIDVRKWYAGKVKPKKYGDNRYVEVDQKVEHSAKTQASELTSDQLVAALRKADAAGLLPAGVKLLDNGDVITDVEYSEVREPLAIEAVETSEDKP